VGHRHRPHGACAPCRATCLVSGRAATPTSGGTRRCAPARPPPAPAARAAALHLAEWADPLLHDAQFTATERRIADAYGHSTIEDALAFAERCGVGRLVLTQTAPGRTDAELDDLYRDVRSAAFTVQGAVIAVR
jgi:hypothetical protein